MVQDELFDHKINSPTGDYEAVYRKDDVDFEEFFRKIQPVNDATGIAVFRGNKLMNIDILGSYTLYTEYFNRILKAAVVALHSSIKYSSLTEIETVELMKTQLREAASSVVQTGKGAGAGFETRFENDTMSGFELRYDERLIHYTLLSKKF